MGAKARMRVGVLAYEGCFAAEIFGFADLLLIANRVARRLDVSTDDVFGVSIMGATSAPVEAAGGHPLGVTRWNRRLDLLVVPGFELVPTHDLDARLATWHREESFIASVADRTIPVASVCVGAFLLGEARVLDGRRATTAWLFAPELAARFPDVTVVPEALVVTDDQVTTTAAFSAALDLAMRLILEHAGPDVARITARITLVADNRTSQAPYTDLSLLDEVTASFARDVQAWLVARLTEPYDLTALSSAFHVSTRTMLRKFSAECGQTPLGFLQHARVDAAKRLLEADDARVSEVMERVGYLDPGSFRRLFTDQVGVTPAVYRRQFRASTPHP